MLGTVAGLAADGTEVIDLKVADSALAEMAEAFRVFRPFRRQRRSPSSARRGPCPTTRPTGAPGTWPARMAGADWMVVTGAGPGIMAAGMEGAGRDRSIGVNIRLPFEQGANTFIAQDPKLVEMRYFFTRKLMLIKESDGYVVLPGGFGTLDEGFELLTLLQTGKAEPAPVVMLDVPGGTFWQAWNEFLNTAVEPRGLVSPEDRALFWSPTTWARQPPRSWASTATTNRADGSATCWSCGCWWLPTRRSWPSSTMEFARHCRSRRHAPLQTVATRTRGP